MLMIAMSLMTAIGAMAGPGWPAQTHPPTQQAACQSLVHREDCAARGELTAPKYTLAWRHLKEAQ